MVVIRILRPSSTVDAKDDQSWKERETGTNAGELILMQDHDEQWNGSHFPIFSVLKDYEKVKKIETESLFQIHHYKNKHFVEHCFGIFTKFTGYKKFHVLREWQKIICVWSVLAERRVALYVSPIVLSIFDKLYVSRFIQ